MKDGERPPLRYRERLHFLRGPVPRRSNSREAGWPRRRLRPVLLQRATMQLHWFWREATSFKESRQATRCNFPRRNRPSG